MTKLDEALTTTITGVNDLETPSGRLSTGELLKTIDLLKTALGNCTEAFNQLHDCDRKTASITLKRLLEQLAGATKHATRLLEADR